MADEPRMPDKLASPVVAARPFVLLAIGILLFLGLTIAGLRTVFDADTPSSIPVAAASPPAPRLQSHEAANLKAVLTAQRARLAGGDNVMPIDKAMAAIVARGADAYAPIAEPPP